MSIELLGNHEHPQSYGRGKLPVAVIQITCGCLWFWCEKAGPRTALPLAAPPQSRSILLPRMSEPSSSRLAGTNTWRSTRRLLCGAGKRAPARPPDPRRVVRSRGLLSSRPSHPTTTRLPRDHILLEDSRPAGNRGTVARSRGKPPPQDKLMITIPE